MSDIKKYLEGWIMARKLLLKQHASKINGYCSMEDFVLKHGRFWMPSKKPKQYEFGKQKECFMNAAKLALNCEWLIYCEGYAHSGLIPTMHAWCVDESGMVIDTTWRKPGREYFGMAFTRKYLIRSLGRNKHYGLLDAWKNGWPLLREKNENWKHPIMKGHNDSSD